MIFATLGSVIPFIFVVLFIPRCFLMRERLEPYYYDCHIRFVMPYSKKTFESSFAWDKVEPEELVKFLIISECV